MVENRDVLLPIPKLQEYFVFERKKKNSCCPAIQGDHSPNVHWENNCCYRGELGGGSDEDAVKCHVRVRFAGSLFY